MVTNKKQTTTKRKGNKKWVKGGASPNPKGAPKRGQSWKEIYNTIGNLTPKEAAEYCSAVAKKIGTIGDQVTLKEAVVLRVYTALLFDPDARLLNVVMDRDEGKVTQPVTEMPWREYVKDQGYDPDVLMKEAEEIVSKRFAELGVSGSNRGSIRAEASRADQPAEDTA